MKRIPLFLIALVISTIATSSARPQQGSVIDDLKRDAIGQIDKLQVFTQQMVDQVFSYSELGFHEYETT
ncbi:MAG: amidohydrolase, partial [Acidobacteria bacterium]|nr:amidohydrolase [Acidobacteriota bacterium]